MGEPALLAEVWRGLVLETTVRGHVAVVDETGKLVASAGDPATVTTVRSTVKPLQALPFVAGGAADRLGAGDESIAIACASHVGEPGHVAVVRDLLGRAGVDESALSCGAQWPYSEEASRALARAGQTPLPVHNNCSGKHAGMLAACMHAGWPLRDYASPRHSLQQAVARAMSVAAGVDVAAQPWGVDGCGLPTYGLSLTVLARAFATAATRCEGFTRCQAAMAAHPVLVAGPGRFDTALLGAAGDRLTAKSGGGACWVAVARPAGPAVAIKLEAGVAAHIPAVAIAALRAADLLGGELPGELTAFAAPPLTNWEGAAVGGTRVRVQLESR